MKTLVALTVALTFTVAQVAPAYADALDEAKAAFAAGKAAFERGDWDTALTQFQRANQLAPAPSLSYNIGKTYEKMGRFHDAAVSYQKYLDQVGPPQNDDDKKFQDFNYAATKQALQRAVTGEPTAKQMLEKMGSVSHPFAAHN